MLVSVPLHGHVSDGPRRPTLHFLGPDDAPGVSTDSMLPKTSIFG